MTLIESVTEKLTHDPGAIVVVLRGLPAEVEAWTDVAEHHLLQADIRIEESSAGRGAPGLQPGGT